MLLLSSAHLNETFYNVFYLHFNIIFLTLSMQLYPKTYVQHPCGCEAVRRVVCFVVIGNFLK